VRSDADKDYMEGRAVVLALGDLDLDRGHVWPEDSYINTRFRHSRLRPVPAKGRDVGALSPT
jgi:hypothetical protein